MPELPEVEYAARIARAACAGKTIATVRALHPSQRRALPDDHAQSLAGDVVVAVARRGKHQLLHLGSGRTLHVHFRMTGDWRVGRGDTPPQRVTRVLFDFADGTQLALDDSRALATVTLHDAGIDPCPALGPDATDDRFDASWLQAQLTGRRAPIKSALLDQRVVAGIGNIYASEALWYARVDPRRLGHRVTPRQCAAIVAGVKRAMHRALVHPERYYGTQGISAAVRFNVYDREGTGCRRCRTAVSRIVQAGRSSYFCRECQR